jgi:bile acid-coenzyme A ligase
MYHNAPFSYAIRALAFGNTLVTSGRRFNAATTLQMLEESSAYWLLVVPTMMHRIWREPTRLHFELQSLEYVWHVGAKCPEWLKESWIQWLGAERVFELYAGTEAQAITCLRGDEWLSHRGSVGRPVAGEISIRDEKSRSMPPGSIGEIFMRPNPGRRTYSYIGARPKAIEGGWESLGDLGYVDESGYLYITDRLSDMIVTGGANVYPAEVEAALEALNDVESAVVVGVPDEDLGLVVSAVVQVRSGSLTTGDSLARQLTENLAKFKIPRQWVLGTTALRDDAGKTRRSTFRELFTNENFERTKL